MMTSVCWKADGPLCSLALQWQEAPTVSTIFLGVARRPLQARSLRPSPAVPPLQGAIGLSAAGHTGAEEDEEGGIYGIVHERVLPPMF
mmetsp:Transcript_62492/g.182683  ORF Transcript_62492/g.182683 Transcript_62492/m.182683 type:complete len:88 (-) Transcript_62492:80-343(-)